MQSAVSLIGSLDNLMKNNFFKKLLVATLFIFHSLALAEDIDLFVGVPVSAGDLPNLMIVMDNAANFSSNAPGSTCVIDGVTTALSGTVGGIEQCALYKVIKDLPPHLDDPDTVKPVVNIGMMVYNDNDIKNSSNEGCFKEGGTAAGGCLVQPLVELNKANKAQILAWIKSWKTSGGRVNGQIKASNSTTAAAMQETWAYYAGRTGISGKSYASDESPLEGCQKNFVVFVGNSYSSSGTPGDSSASGNGPKNSLLGTNPSSDKNASPAADSSQQTVIANGKNTSCGAYTFKDDNVHENKGHYADEWARYMASQRITTYTVGVLGSACRAEYAALLSNMADYGGGLYFPTTDYDELVNAFQRILSQIQSVNSVFASVSLPVSVNTQGTYLNQVFVGMFRPDQNALPKWQGNLKQYKLGYDNGVLGLLGADDVSAISAGGSGFIAECAVSYWTKDSEYWNRNFKENCEGDPAISDSSDGNLVEKGGQAQMLRSMTVVNRKLKTCDATCANLDEFDIGNANITKASLGNTSMTNTERENLIKWARGLNNNSTGETADAAATAMRSSSHGDVVHSRPVAIEYASGDVVVFYGGNDGVFRAINGNRDKEMDATTPPTIAGGEIWSFIPTEFYPKIKRLYDNAQTIDFPEFVTESEISPAKKDYGMDGPVTAYNENGVTYVYATMRRGGNAVYAFDVTNIESPSLMWKLSASDLPGLGQTWSSPKVIKQDGKPPMLIMGGGYDICQDEDPNDGCNTSSTGTKVYVIDAESGNLLKQFDTESSVIGDVTVIPDSTGVYAKFAYVADLGGNVYRISGATANSPIGTTDADLWTITKIAKLGGTGSNNRKFMFAPDVVDENGTYVLLLGSGDREKPLEFYSEATNVDNHFYMIKDQPMNASWLTNEVGNCDGEAVICINSLYQIATSATPTATELATKPKGWYLDLDDQEKVVTSAITVFGTVTFSTHKPFGTNDEKCTPTLGTATVYNIGYINAAPLPNEIVRGSEIAGGGLPPSPVAGMVTLDDGRTVPFIIGSDSDSALQGGLPPTPPLVARPKSRVYWNIRK